MITPEVMEIHRTLEAAGFETWCVGGAVRDALMGDPHSDIDLATAAPPGEVRRLFRRTVPLGIEHGTVGVIDAVGGMHEVTTFRRDVTTDGRHAVVEFGVSLDEDLARRDFTINAVAWHPVRNEWHDPFNGRSDIEAGVIRTVGDPLLRFAEDRLRILRAMRFASRFGFRIEKETWQACCRMAPETVHLSPERVREEWWKGIGTAKDSRTLLRLWEESGVAAAWVSGTGQESSALPHLRDPDPLLVLSWWRSPVEPILRNLRCSNAEIARGRGIDRGPASPASEDAGEVRRWLAAVGSAADDLTTLATWRGEDPGGWPSVVSGIRERGEATSRADLRISGDELLAAGVVESGPALGKLLSVLLDAVIRDPSLNEPATLLELARRSGVSD